MKTTFNRIVPNRTMNSNFISEATLLNVFKLIDPSNLHDSSCSFSSTDVEGLLRLVEYVKATLPELSPLVTSYVDEMLRQAKPTIKENTMITIGKDDPYECEHSILYLRNAMWALQDQYMEFEKWLHYQPWEDALDLFCILCDHLTDDEYWEQFGNAYVLAALRFDHKDLRQLLSCNRGDIKDMMTTTEKNEYYSLPETISLYHVMPAEMYVDKTFGVSWTSSRETAVNLKSYFEDKFNEDSLIAQVTANKKEIIACINRRYDSEVLFIPKSPESFTPTIFHNL